MDLNQFFYGVIMGVWSVADNGNIDFEWKDKNGRIKLDLNQFFYGVMMGVWSMADNGNINLEWRDKIGFKSIFLWGDNGSLERS